MFFWRLKASSESGCCVSLKFSICIVNYKQYDELNRCIELINKREEKDYEIICWDNTPSYEASKRLFPPHSDLGKWLNNGEENGFARGVNLAAKEAKGDILVFLNPDTEPTGDWLDRMARGLDRFDYIGATSDYIGGIQSYLRYVDDPREFIPTKLIIPVCAMIPRALFLGMGGFDEQFFLGCEDLDFSWRMNQAGWKMAVAADVFIHHIGHTSFEVTKDGESITREMEHKIRAKLKEHYGDSVPSSDELWGCNILPTVLKRQTLSICAICREVTIEVLEWKENLHALNLADEIIIEPVGIIDDFSAARNLALSKCTGDYVLWLDDDDVIEEDSARRLRHALDHLTTAMTGKHFAYSFNMVDHSYMGVSILPQIRMFPRLDGIKWSGRIHEHQGLIGSCEALGIRVRTVAEIEVHHYGYSDPEVYKSKQERNLRLLSLEPVTYWTLYHSGVSLIGLKEYEAAKRCFTDDMLWRFTEPTPLFALDQCAYLLAALEYERDRAGWTAKMVWMYLEGNKKPDAAFLRGEYLYDTGNYDKAKIEFQAYLDFGDISDPFGTNQASMRPTCEQRLKEINDA